MPIFSNPLKAGKIQNLIINSNQHKQSETNGCGRNFGIILSIFLQILSVKEKKIDTNFIFVSFTKNRCRKNLNINVQNNIPKIKSKKIIYTG